MTVKYMFLRYNKRIFFTVILTVWLYSENYMHNYMVQYKTGKDSVTKLRDMANSVTWQTPWHKLRDIKLQSYPLVVNDQQKKRKWTSVGFRPKGAPSDPWPRGPRTWSPVMELRMSRNLPCHGFWSRSLHLFYSIPNEINCVFVFFSAILLLSLSLIISFLTIFFYLSTCILSLLL